ncbi:hypothetical protein GCM10022600_15150 [Qipengyuania pelagi]
MPAEDYPWLGQPRWYSATAMPNGDARHGVEGQLVMLTEYRSSSIEAVGAKRLRGAPSDQIGALPKIKLLSRGEAEGLLRELQGALRTFDRAERMAAGDAPGVARGPYPFRDHRTLAEVDAA